MNKGFQTIEEQFVDYHAKHPEVYTELVAIAVGVRCAKCNKKVEKCKCR
jgi:hypothetical protein